LIALRLSPVARRTFLGAVKLLFLAVASVLLLAGALIAQVVSSPEVPYPDGYRQWRHITSGVLPPKQVEANSQPNPAEATAPHGMIHHIYANEKALEGYLTGHFPEGAVLIADWFVLEEKGGALRHGPRHSIDVMIRDARYTDTGGWGFEKFDKDSRTTRTVGPNAVQSCFACHTGAEDREFVFSVLKP
jgi:hypothetical protein